MIFTKRIAFMLTLLSLIASSRAFAPPIRKGKTHSRQSIGTLSKKNDDDDDRDWMSPSDIENQQKTSKKVMQKLLFSYSFGQAVNFALWSFVIVDVLLGLFGYSFIFKDGGLVVGTLEEQQFQKEIIKAMKEKRLGGDM